MSRCFTAQPKSAERYFLRLLAAPGLSALRSINIMTTAAVTFSIGHAAIADLAPGLGGSRRHSSISRRLVHRDLASRAVNRLDPKYEAASHPSVPGGAARNSLVALRPSGCSSASMASL